jgi:hypothetical protein
MAGRRNNIAWWRRVRRVAYITCVASAMVWLASVIFYVAVPLGRQWNVSIARGSLNLMYWNYKTQLPRATSWGHAPRWPDLLPKLLRLPTGSQVFWTVAVVPLWPVPLAFAGLTWYAGKRIKRLRRDVCAKCGYDTRGLAAGAVCPECGAACGGPR